MYTLLITFIFLIVVLISMHKKDKIEIDIFLDKKNLQKEQSQLLL